MSKVTLKQSLADFRAEHFKDEMAKNLDVARSIRDDPKNSAKDRNEAVKTISRMLGSLAPEKVSSATTTAKTKQDKLTEKDRYNIDQLINETNQMDESKNKIPLR